MVSHIRSEHVRTKGKDSGKHGASGKLDSETGGPAASGVGSTSSPNPTSHHFSAPGGASSGKREALSSWSSVPAQHPSLRGLDEGRAFTLGLVCPERHLSMSWGGRQVGHLPSLPSTPWRTPETPAPASSPPSHMTDAKAVRARVCEWGHSWRENAHC